MSVLIKDMKMPTGCLSCDFCNLFGLYDERYCRRLMRTTTGVTRLNNCPLIGVPDGHGRLIDANALFEEIYKAWGITADASDCSVLMQLINDAPTIIPASKEEAPEMEEDKK